MRIFNTPMGRRSGGNDNAGAILPDFAAEYRRTAGAWLRTKREAKGLTQAEASKLMGFSAPTSISAFETGRAALAPERYEDYAHVLGVDPAEMGRTMLRWSNPWLYLMVVNPKDKALRDELADLPNRYFTRDVPHSSRAK